MKTINKFLIIAATSFLGLNSCDVLNQEPVSAIASANFYKTATDAEAAIIGCYDGYQYDMSNIMISPNIVGDDGFGRSGGNNTRMQTFAVNSGQGNIGDHWRNMYAAIGRCNDAIEGIAKVTDPSIEPKRNQLMGEAYFLRAWTYFMLVRWYGPIPVITMSTKSMADDIYPSRQPVEKVYDQIIADLLEAEKLTSINMPNKFRASKGAAKAMLARVYLHRIGVAGTTTAQKQELYQKALVKCEEVMADQQFKLVDGDKYADIFTIGKQNTSESIFEISYRPNISVEGTNLDNEYVPATGNSYRVMPDNKLIAAFNASVGDKRKDISFNTYNGKVYINKNTAGHPSIAVNRRLQDCNVIILRLADVVLMRAEALTELNRTNEAIPFLNQIRNRAGLLPTTATSQADVRLAIENERYLELCFEGVRWFDLVRTGRAQANIPELTDLNRILWPVPDHELSLNPNLLPQNPSY